MDTPTSDFSDDNAGKTGQTSYWQTSYWQAHDWRNIRSFIWRWVKRGALALCGLVFLVHVYAILTVIMLPPTTLNMLGSTLVGRDVQRDGVSLERISPNLVRAVIAAEDSRFCQHDGIDFDAAQDANPSQAFELPINRDGEVHMTTSISAFTNVTRMVFYFTGNHGDEESTGIQYIGMQGDHTHDRRAAVHTSYELIGVDEEGLASRTTMQAQIQ